MAKKEFGDTFLVQKCRTTEVRLIRSGLTICNPLTAIPWPATHALLRIDLST